MAKNWKTLRKIIFIVLGVICLISASLYTFLEYNSNEEFPLPKNEYKKRVAYINPEKALASNNFEICDSTYIVDYYNYSRGETIHSPTKYISNKNGLKKKVYSQYQNKSYSDSGYLNFRFIVNCKGESGAYVIYENDLNLEPIKFNPNLVKQLFDITLTLNKWQPNFMRGATRDSYMYISYKIENGDITEILP